MTFRFFLPFFIVPPFLAAGSPSKESISLALLMPVDGLEGGADGGANVWGANSLMGGISAWELLGIMGVALRDTVLDGGSGCDIADAGVGAEGLSRVLAGGVPGFDDGRGGTEDDSVIAEVGLGPLGAREGGLEPIGGAERPGPLEARDDGPLGGGGVGAAAAAGPVAGLTHFLSLSS